MIVTTASLIVMPVLAWLKLRAARELSYHAVRADAFETIASVGLSAATLADLAMNFALKWKWADPLAALLLGVVHIIVTVRNDFRRASVRVSSFGMS
jgi:divalent metal cation (Fe/Co/Zn/Cd) transporter